MNNSFGINNNLCTIFEHTGDYRRVSDKQLVYEITNSQQAATNYETMLTNNERAALSELLETLTPGRKKVAKAAIEMYKRTIEREVIPTKIMMSKDIFNIMRAVVSDLEIEEFWVILLNQSNGIIKRIRLSIGGIDCTMVDIRLIIKHAILSNATGVVLVHNHPSGSLVPSKQDIEITRTAEQAMKTVNIKLIDHLIIGANSYYSFADEGSL